MKKSSLLLALVVAFCQSVHLTFMCNERPILVDIPTYNNSEWFTKNLESIYAQRYANYRVIITDDCSTDGTAELIEEYIKQHHQEHRTMLIKNRFRRGALANHYNVIQLARDDEIILHMDGDDWANGTNVFYEVNKMYKDPSVWFTYGKFVNWPTEGEACYSRPPGKEESLERKQRSSRLIFYPLRTYQARLAKYIKLEDLICYNTTVPFVGKFYPFACDVALMYALFELSGGVHYFFNTKVMYIRNIATPLNDFKVNLDLQKACGRIIRTETPRYKPLRELVSRKIPPLIGHLFVIARDSEHLASFLKTIVYLEDIGAVTVLYRAKNSREARSYHALIKSNRRCAFINTANDYSAKLFIKNLEKSAYYYILLTTPNYILTGAMSLKRYFEVLEKTFSYTISLFYRAGYEPPHDWLVDNMYVWKLGHTKPGWQKPHNLSMSIYRKQDLINSMKKIAQKGTVDAFLKRWFAVSPGTRKVGLFAKNVPVAIRATVDN